MKYYIRRSSGKVFGPFPETAIASMLEQNTLDGDETVSPDKENWIPLQQLPVISGEPAPPDGPPPVPLVPEPLEEEPEEPEEAADSSDDGPSPLAMEQPPVSSHSPESMLDLPMPPLEGEVQGVDGDFDMGGFDMDTGEVDLDELDDDQDLPAPKQQPGGGALGELADLPAPKPSGMMDGAMDLPAPKEGAVASEFADLPAPKLDPGEFADLPVHKPEAVDLPAPKGDPAQMDLPEPKGAKDPEANMLEPKGDLPEPKGLKGFFEYGQVDEAEGDDEGLGDLDEIPEMGDVEVDAEPEVDLPPPDPEFADLTPEEEPAEGEDEPGEPPEDKDLVRFEPVADEGEEAPVVTVAKVSKAKDEDQEEDEERARRRKLVRVVRFAVLGLLVVGLLGVVPMLLGYGPWFTGLMTGEHAQEEKGNKLRTEALVALQQDTFPGYRKAASGLGESDRILDDDNPDVPGQRVQALAAALVRFGTNKGIMSEAKDLAAKLDITAEAPVSATLGRHLMSLAQGRAKLAADGLVVTCGKHAEQAMCWVYLGWTQHRLHKYNEAARAFDSAIKLNPKLPAALFGMAQTNQRLGPQKRKQVGSWLNKAIEANPEHTGARLMRARLQLQSRDAGQLKLGRAAAATLAKAKAAPSEIAEAQAMLGQIALDSGDVNKARSSFDAAMKTYPNSPAARIGKGRILLSDAQYKAALKQFREAKKLAPGNLTAHLMEVRTLMATGDLKTCRQLLIKLRELAPNSAELSFLLGRVAHQLHQYVQAGNHYRAAIKLQTNYFEPYLFLSRLHLTQKQENKALAVLAQADKALPKAAEVRNAQGELYLATRKFKKAHELFTEALKLDPKLNVAMFNLGATLAKQGKLDLARKKLLALQQRDRKFPGLAAMLGQQMVSQKEYAEAAKQYDLALTVDAPRPALRLAAATAFAKAKQFDKALVQANTALREDAALIAPARALRAEAFLSKDKPLDALTEILTAIDREPLARYYVIQGRIYETIGMSRVSDAIDAYSNALKRDKSLFHIQERRGILMVKDGRANDGLKILIKVVRRRPSGEGYMYAGDAYWDTGKEAKATKAYKSAVGRAPKLARAHYKLGVIYFDTRKHTLAMTHLQQATKYVVAADLWHAEAYRYLGQAHEALKHKKAALEAYLKYLKLARAGDAMVPVIKKRLPKLGWKPPKEETLP